MPPKSPLITDTLEELRSLIHLLDKAHATGDPLDIMQLERIAQIASQRSLRAAMLEYNAGQREAPRPLTPDQRLIVDALERQIAQLENLGTSGDRGVDLLVREIVERVREAPHRASAEQLARVEALIQERSGRVQLVAQLARQISTLGERLADQLEVMSLLRGEKLPASGTLEESARWLAEQLER